MNETQKELRAAPMGGYPHEGIQSQIVFPNRIATDIVDDRVLMLIDKGHYPQWDDSGTQDEREGFLMDRIHDYNNALGIAENQIRDMRQVSPFIPESFGFKIVPDQPELFYQKGEWIMKRALGTSWVATKDTAPLWFDLPSEQIAFITLRALGIISDADFETPTEIEVRVTADAPVEPSQATKDYNAEMERRNEFNRKYASWEAEWNQDLKCFITPDGIDGIVPGIAVDGEVFYFDRITKEIFKKEGEVKNA